MTHSYTTTSTFTRTDARYLAGKVTADLRQMQQEYGAPADAWITNYLAELTELLVGGYVKEVTYGYRRDDKWVAALRYSADTLGQLTADDRSGRIPRGADVTGATWGSFLIHTDKWSQLPETERNRIEKALPFQRTGGQEPGSSGWSTDKTYSSSGCSLRRGTVGGAG